MPVFEIKQTVGSPYAWLLGLITSNTEHHYVDITYVLVVFSGIKGCVVLTTYEGNVCHGTVVTAPRDVRRVLYLSSSYLAKNQLFTHFIKYFTYITCSFLPRCYNVYMLNGGCFDYVT